MKCDRCKAETRTYRMSWFNTQHICPACQQEELQHEKCEVARKIEFEEVKKGNLNFKGIGLPEDLRLKYGC